MVPKGAHNIEVPLYIIMYSTCNLEELELIGIYSCIILHTYMYYMYSVYMNVCPSKQNNYC